MTGIRKWLMFKVLHAKRGTNKYGNGDKLRVILTLFGDRLREMGDKLGECSGGASAELVRTWYIVKI